MTLLVKALSVEESAPAIIHNVTNTFSTTPVSFNGWILNLGDTTLVNQSMLSIFIKKLVQGEGSNVTLETIIDDNNASHKNYEYTALVQYYQDSVSSNLSTIYYVKVLGFRVRVGKNIMAFTLALRCISYSFHCMSTGLADM